MDGRLTSLSVFPGARWPFWVSTVVAALDLTGPLEALSVARLRGANGNTFPCYRPIVVALTKRILPQNPVWFSRRKRASNSRALSTQSWFREGAACASQNDSRLAAEWLATQAEVHATDCIGFHWHLCARGKRSPSTRRAVTTHLEVCP